MLAMYSPLPFRVTTHPTILEENSHDCKLPKQTRRVKNKDLDAYELTRTPRQGLVKTDAGSQMYIRYNSIHVFFVVVSASE